jgi:hypothetical protein
VSELAIHDEDAQRRQTLLTRLAGLGLGTVRAGSADRAASIWCSTPRRWACAR